MNLYAWQPKGYGESSFFVCAENEENAKDAVNKYIQDNSLDVIDVAGWGTDYYRLKILPPMSVIINYNE